VWSVELTSVAVPANPRINLNEAGTQEKVPYLDFTSENAWATASCSLSPQNSAAPELAAPSSPFQIHFRIHKYTTENVTFYKFSVFLQTLQMLLTEAFSVSNWCLINDSFNYSFRRYGDFWIMNWKGYGGRDVPSRSAYYPGPCLKRVHKHENLSSILSSPSPRFELAERYSEAWELEPAWSLSVPRGEPFT
jgi:hypothetical protein